MKAHVALFLTVSLTFKLVQGFSFTKFLSAKCLVLDPKSIELNYCFVKSYSRTNTVINIGVNLTRNMHKPGYVSKVQPKIFNSGLWILKFSGADLFVLSVREPLPKNHRQPSVWVVRCNGNNRYEPIVQVNGHLVQGFDSWLLPPVSVSKGMIAVVYTALTVSRKIVWNQFRIT